MKRFSNKIRDTAASQSFFILIGKIKAVFWGKFALQSTWLQIILSN